MPVFAEGRVENQKRTQTASTFWAFGFVFGYQLGLLEKTRRGQVHAALVHVWLMNLFEQAAKFVLQKKK